MYHLYNNECYYDYKPGWFDEIPVSSATIKWNKSGVTYANNEIEIINTVINTTITDIVNTIAIISFVVIYASEYCLSGSKLSKYV